jgi:hypothetical protein
VIESDDEESIFLLGILLPLVLAVRKVELLHRVVVRLDLLVDPTNVVRLLSDGVLSSLDLCDDLLVI